MKVLYSGSTLEQDLPIDGVIPELLDALKVSSGVVLQAPPGAGKTTRVPLALLDTAWRGDGKILMLEPRRLAARAAALRMAETIGESVGETVGFRVRGESRISPKTRIEVVTEGILTGMIQRDPELKGVAAIIFDEYHERSLHADLGLALALDCQEGLREDLRILVMSATLDGAPIAALLSDGPVITSDGRTYPVDTLYRPRLPRQDERDAIVPVIHEALADNDGSLLVFLPGEREIRAVEAQLTGSGLGPTTTVAPLYGALSPSDQDRALRPAPTGHRKVVLATDIAETSLTIEGIRIVVDGGQRRAPRFDPRSGMTALETRRISQASAEQRRGRAGRTEPGVCYRLWGEAEHKGLEPFSPPEIVEGDLAPLLLELARWGVVDAGQLRWLNPPPPGPLAQARELLSDLGALDKEGRITRHGTDMATLGAHPRLAHMMLKGRDLGCGQTACALAALLEERDIIRLPRGEGNVDITMRLDLMAPSQKGKSALPHGAALNKGALHRARQSAERWLQRLSLKRGQVNSHHAGPLIALAYPDRIAARRSRDGARYLMANGRGATLPDNEPLAAEDWLAIATLGGSGSEGRVYLAAPMTIEDVQDLYGERFRTEERVDWDDRRNEVVASTRTLFNQVTITDKRLEKPEPEHVQNAMVKGVRKLGLGALPWTSSLRNWRARVQLLRAHDEDDWPDLSDEALSDTLDQWLLPFLEGCRKKADLDRVKLSDALKSLLDWDQRQRLEKLAPTHVTVPSGSSIPLDYNSGEQPILAVRLQEMFGQTETPTIAAGRVKLLVHLLSPAGRPLQVTQDLKVFWSSSYHAVKAEMKGRSPKHPWPDDPLNATPTNRAKPRKNR